MKVFPAKPGSPWRQRIALAGAAVLLGATAWFAVPLLAQADDIDASNDFDAFIDQVEATRYPDLTASGDAGRIRDAAEFSQMSDYILDLYDGVDVN
ncbi:MAG: hypothetical protein ACRD0P_24720, partial [Stackebrandtia sp.]